MIQSSNPTPFQKTITELLDGYKTQLEEQEAAKIAGMDPSTVVAGAVGLSKIGLGVAGLFNKTDDLPEVKSNYTIDPNLTAAANYATSKAFETPEDYAARIRLRNQRIAQTMRATSISGGDRNFIAANEAAARDIENTGNLQTDIEGKRMQAQNLGVAANLQQMALFDRLNKSRDEMNAAELNLKSTLFEIEQRNRNIAGAANLIASGLNDFSSAAGNEIAVDAQRGYQKVALLNALSKIGIEQEENAAETLKKKFAPQGTGDMNVPQEYNKQVNSLFKTFEEPTEFSKTPNNTYSRLFS